MAGTTASVRPAPYRALVGALHARLLDELGYDPDDGVPQLVEFDTSDASPGAAGEVASLSDESGSPGSPGSRPLIDVPIGRVVAARDGARAVAVARLESGRLVIVADECPHDGGRISDGFVSGELLVCTRHGWELETCAGKCIRAPRS